MKVKELIKKLQEVDPNMPVFCTSNIGEHDYCIVNNASARHIYIDWGSDEESGNEETLVFVIDEE